MPILITSSGALMLTSSIQPKKNSQTRSGARCHYIKKRTKHGVRPLTKEPHKPTPNLDIKTKKRALYYNNRPTTTTYIKYRPVDLPPA